MIAEVVVADWTAGEVAGMIGATLLGRAEAHFAAATTDSRESRPGAAFFALDGARHRGVQFVPAAFGSGCSVVVVPNDWTGEIPPGRAALKVADPMEALVALARRVRATWTCPVVAVTGSAGKTTVKEMTAHVLGGLGDVLRSPGNFNTMVGLARTILDSRETPDVAVLEVGASALGEIARLASLVRPAAAAVTNVAPAHLEGFGSIAGVRTEKLSLFSDLPSDALRLVDGDDPELVAAAEKYGRVTRVGFAEDNDLAPRDLQLDAAGRATFLWREHRLVLSVPGRHQAKNALFALAFAESLGVSPAEAVGRLATFTGVPGRLALLERNGVTIADDSYNSNPRSVDVALSWLVGAATTGRRIAVLGDMLELGTESEDFHAELGAKVAGLGLDLVVFVGSESRAAFAARPAAGGGEWHHVETAEHASELLAGLVAPGDLVLIKGSRGVGLDRVVRALAPAGEGA